MNKRWNKTIILIITNGWLDRGRKSCLGKYMNLVFIGDEYGDFVRTVQIVAIDKNYLKSRAKFVRLVDLTVDPEMNGLFLLRQMQSFWKTILNF